MGVKITGRVTARAYAKRDPHFCSSGPIILAKMNSSSNDYSRPCSGHSRISPRGPCHRRQYTILSYLKRWIANIWYSIMRRVKSMFSTQVDPDIPGSNSTRKIPSEMDSELENLFWREGIQRSFFVPRTSRIGYWDRRYFGLGDNADVYSLYRIKQDPKFISSDDSGSEKDVKKSEERSPKLQKNRHLPERVNSALSFDDEYNALYEKKVSPRPLSGPARASGNDIEKFGNLTGDYTASGTDGEKNNSCGGISPGLDRSKCFSKRRSNFGKKMETPKDGEWVRTVCFEQMQLHNPVSNRQAAEKRTGKTSRIPRLCSLTMKTFPKNE